MVFLAVVREKIDSVRIIIKYTENPLACIRAYILHKKEKIRFRWNFLGDFDWKTIWFVLKLAEAEWYLGSYDGGFFTFTDGKLKFVTDSFDGVDALMEKPNPYHCFDYRNAVVLDIGAFTGDSIVLFIKWGAKKVIAYEPVPKNVEQIRLNAEINKFGEMVTVVPYGVAGKEGFSEFCYDRFNKGFGLKPGCQKISLPCVSFREVLKGRDDISIAKVDCEGCEKHLLEVNELLIPKWIVEVHDPQLLPLLVKHFESKGFEVHSKQHEGFFLVQASLENRKAKRDEILSNVPKNAFEGCYSN